MPTATAAEIKSGQTITITWLPGHPRERVVTGRVFIVMGHLVVSDGPGTWDLITLLVDGKLNPNLRVEKIEEAVA